MPDYKPPTRFNVAMQLLFPTNKEYNGVNKKVFPESGPVFFGSFRTFGGTETQVNGVFGIENTAVVETWFNPSITPDCRIKLGTKDYDIIQDPENIDQYSQYMRFKVRLVGGEA